MKRAKRFMFAAVIFALIVVSVITVGKMTIKTLFPLEHIESVLSAAEEFEIDPYLLLALIKAESNFVSDAQSHKDAYGLMQITEPTAAWIAEKTEYDGFKLEQLSDPEINIHMGSWYLSYLLSLYNMDEKLALCAYNAGMGNVDSWLADAAFSPDGKTLYNIPFAETQKYIEKIEKYKSVYQKLYPEL